MNRLFQAYSMKVSCCISLLLLAIFIELAGATTPMKIAEMAKQKEMEHSSGMAHQSHRDQPTIEVFHRNSLYQLESTWLNQYGEQLEFANLRGKFQLVTMAYTLCNHACPILVADLKRIEQLLPASLGKELGLVFISIDPQRDTPDQLRRYAEKMALSTNWQLLQGDSMGVLEMAALLGVRFRKELDGTFSHSNLITLLDKEGVIIFRLEGLRQDPALLIQTILNAAQ